MTITNRRDNTGRLQALLPNADEPVIRDTEFAGDKLIGSRVLGNDRIRFESAFDTMKRPVSRRYLRVSDNQPLVDVRYAYDRNGAQLARQFVHLSPDLETAMIVGRRKTPKPVILEVQAHLAEKEGEKFFEMTDRIWLAAKVAPKFLRVLE